VCQVAPTLARSSALEGATVTGDVKFVGEAPANPAIDMSEESKCQVVYRTTPPAGGGDDDGADVCQARGRAAVRG
jgi:hypothetical protein